MYSHTDALIRLRTAMQEVFEFAVVVCSAVPCLKKCIKLYKDDPSVALPTPEHFKRPIRVDQLSAGAGTFKPQLVRLIFLSSFSYFEAYVADCCRELLAFHRERLPAHFDQEAISNLVVDPKFLKSKRKLQDRYDPKKWQAYKKHTNELRELGYAFPKDILASYAIRTLLAQTAEGNIKANDIPHFLRTVLLLELDAKTEQAFHNYREVRNRIAHGKTVNLHMKELVTIGHFFRDLATKIDQHVVECFFVIEE
jgi:hypothetical protein